MKRLWLICILMGVGLITILAQRTIQGTVTDASGETLLGASVLVKNTQLGTITDVDGSYQLTVPDSSEFIIVSYTGYTTQEIPLTNSRVINVTLQEGLTLETAVVTAIGISRSKKALGYAVSDVKADDLQLKAESDVVRLLAGKVPGINVQGSNGAPGASTNIVIRGNSSLLGNNQPLFVVDGIPFDNSMMTTQNNLISGSSYASRALDIDPNDIESLSVLKGAAASALYGSRAANGVILITTKSGKGALNARKGLEVTIQSSYTTEQIAGIPRFQNRFGQGGTTGGGSGIYSSRFFGSWGPSVNDVDRVIDWKGNEVAFQTYENNVRDFFETGHNFENSINIAGGSELSRVNMTFSHTKTKSFIPNAGLERYNLRLGGNTQLANGLFASGSLSYINTSQTGPPTGGGGVVSSGFSTQLWFLPRSYDPYAYPYKDENNEDNHYRTGEDHPLFSVFENPFTAKVTRMFANASLSYDINNWLSLKYQIGFDNYAQKNKQVFAASSQFAPAGNITVDDLLFRSIESNLLLTANRRLNDDFSLNLVLGHNINQRELDRQAFSGNGIIVYGIDDLDNTENVVPSGGTSSQRRLVGVFGDASLSFRDYLFLGLTARNDWSSTLPVGDNSFFYSAATLGFVFTDLIKIKPSLLSYGKLRLAYGKVGNDAGVYNTQELLYNNGNFGTALGALVYPFNNQPGLTLVNTLGNNQLTPEFTTEFEVGTTLHFWNNKIKLDLSYFDRVTTDQIFSVNRPPSSGFIAQILNAGKVSNRGWEIGLGITPFQSTAGFTWEVFGTFTKVDNVVEELIEGVTRIGIGQNFSTLGTYAVPGEAFGVIQGSAVAKDKDGNYLIDPNTGYWITDPDNTRIIGDPNPDFLASVSNTLSYKAVTMSFLFDYKHGGDLYSATLASMRGRGVLEETAEGDIRQQAFVLPGVLGNINNPGEALLDENGNTIANNIYIDANDYFWRTSSNAPSEFGIYDATVVRLRELSVAYTFSRSTFKNSVIGTMEIRLIGRNLWFYAPNLPKGYDPETNGRGRGNAQGMEFAYVPNARRYGMSLSVTF